MKTLVEVKLRSRAAFHVETRVMGNQFAIGLEGQTVACWNDPRIAAGAIGFEAARDARVRLYWVKLSSPEANAERQPGAIRPRIGVMRYEQPAN